MARIYNISSQTDKLQYPIPSSGKDGLLYSLTVGVFVAIFLWYFEPFNLNIQPYTTREILFFGVISFTICFIAHTLLPFFVPNIYKERTWTIYSQTLFYLVQLLIIATANGLYVNTLDDLSFDWYNYLMMIIKTIAVGIFPITLYVLLTYTWTYRKIANRSKVINDNLATQASTPPQQYSIQTYIKNEYFLINTDTFLFAKASGNYIEVHSTDTSTKLYRMSLSDLDKQLSSSDNIFRCHRSYTINTEQVVQVTGNAQGLKLWLNDELHVPVSRNYLDTIKSVFSKN